MASDSDLEAYFNQLSRKSHSLQKQNIKSDSPSLSKSTLTPTFDDDHDDDDLHSRKASSKQNFQKKKVETVPGSLLDIKSLSEKYSKSKPEIPKKQRNNSSLAEGSNPSSDKERLYDRNLNKEKINVHEYNKHNAVTKKPRSMVIDDDSSMDEELAKYLNETSLHEEEISKASQYDDVKEHSSSNSSSSGSPLLNLNNLHTVGDILGTRTDDNSKSESILHEQIKSNQKEDPSSTKNKSASKIRSVQIDTLERSESDIDKDEKGTLLRNLNSKSLFYSKGLSDNSSYSNLQLIPPKNTNQKQTQNEDISITEIESISVIEENESIVEENESIFEESENIYEESILESDKSIEEDAKSERYSKSNNSLTSDASESVSESSESRSSSQRESAFENEDSSSRNKNILEKSEKSKGVKYETNKPSVREISKNKSNKASETSVSSSESSSVKHVDKHTASSSRKKSKRKESKTTKYKESENELKNSNRQRNHSRKKKKKRYTRSSRSSSSDSSSDSSSSLSDSELLNISKKLYQKLKHRTHSSYYEKEARKFPKWSYPVYAPSAYGLLLPPSFSSVGEGNSGILSHTAIMRQQVELTRMFMDSQKAMYSAYTSVLHSSHHFTTIKDTEKYIKKKRNPILTFEEALKLVKEEMKTSQ